MKKTTRQVNQEQWFMRIEQFLDKGISQEAYCQEAGLKKGTFSYWLRKYRSSSSSLEETRSGFISLRPVESPCIDQEITIRFGAVEVNLPVVHNLEILIPLIKGLA